MWASSYALDLKTKPSTNVPVLFVLVRKVNTGLKYRGKKILSYRLVAANFLACSLCLKTSEIM